MYKITGPENAIEEMIRIKNEMEKNGYRSIISVSNYMLGIEIVDQSSKTLYAYIAPREFSSNQND